MFEPSITDVAGPRNLRDSVERQVLRAIATGEYYPGDLISVPTLAAQFQVSATPVREAMVNLQSRGLVTPVRNKGFRITEISGGDVSELMQVWLWVEAPAIREIARVFPRERIEEFREFARQIVHAVDTDDIERFMEAEEAFHEELLGLLHNRYLLETVRNLRHQMRTSVTSWNQSMSCLRRAATEHHLLLDCLMDNDVDGAERIIRAHIAQIPTG